LREENVQLRQQLETLQADLARSRTEHTALRQQLQHRPESADRTGIGAAQVGSGNGPGTSSGSGAPSPVTAMRTHLVQRGESPIAIARKYGIKLSAFMAANPGLDPRRMPAGKTVNIPAP
jgi:hypothetical protein